MDECATVGWADSREISPLNDDFLFASQSAVGGVDVTLSKTYPPPTGVVLQNLVLKCVPGEIVAILGASGCGKSTILGLLAGVVDPDPPISSGQNIERTRLSGSFSLAFQRAHLLPWRDTMGNAFFEADVLGVDREMVKKDVDELLAIVRLEGAKSLFPVALSVGMQQRLQLVRATVGAPRMVLLDEPLGAVDQPLRLDIAKHLRTFLRDRGCSALWVTHDSLEAVTAADRVLVLAGKPAKIIAEHSVVRDIEIDNHRSSSSSTTEARDISLDAQAHRLRERLRNEYQVSRESLVALAAGDVPLVRPKASGTKGVLSLAIFQLLPLVPAAVLLVSWELLIALMPDLEFYLSKPSIWIPRLIQLLSTREFVRQIGVTLGEAFAGVGVALPLGIVIGFAAATRESFSRMIRPTVIGMTAIPLFVLAPAFILWFGIGKDMKVAIAALSSFPFVAHLVMDAAAEVKGIYHSYLLRRGAKESRLFIHLLLPGALNGLILCIRPAVVAALIGAFLGEFIAAEDGLGHFILLQAGRYRMQDVLAGVAVLYVLAIVVDHVFRRLAEVRYKWISRMGL